MTGSSGSPTEPRIGSFGVPSFLLASRFPSVPLADHESVLRARSGPCRVGRRGKAARSRGRSCHRTGRAAPAAHFGRGNPGLATGARPRLARRRPGAASSHRQAPLSAAAASLLPAAATGPANQTRAFPAGAGQSAARVCWKRETLRGKAITKAFHCRQMLSVCADFSCF